MTLERRAQIVRAVTPYCVAITVMLVLGYDLAVGIATNGYATISWLVCTASMKRPVIAFAAGLLVMHILHSIGRAHDRRLANVQMAALQAELQRCRTRT